MTHETPQPTQQAIIDHVPTQAELLAQSSAEVPGTRASQGLAHIGVGSSVEVAPVDASTPYVFEELPRVPKPSVAQQVARQMNIDRADRSNRASAGLPPRPYDLR